MLRFRLILILLSLNSLLLAQISLIKSIELPKSIIQAVYQPNGNNFAVVHANKQIHIFDTKTFELKTILDDKGEGDISIAYSPDGNYLLAGSWDKTIKLWDLSKGMIIRRYFGHEQATRSVSFNPQGNMIASAGWDMAIHFWYVPTGINLKNLYGHTQCVRSITFSADGSKIATGGYDQLLKLWDIASGKELFSVKTSSFPVEVVVFSPDGNYIATAGLENNIKLWDAKKGSLVRVFKGHTDAVYALAFSPDGKYLASGGNDNIIRIWEVETGNTLFQLKGHNQGIRTLAFSPDGKQLLSGAVDKLIKIWNTTSLHIAPLIREKPLVLYNNPTQININVPSQNPYVSTKRILPVSFEIKNNDYNIVHLFLNKNEYTRLINNNKEIVKPLSVKVNYNKNIEINYEIYLDYDQSEIQLAAFKPSSEDFVISPELIVSYFDLESYKSKTNLNVLNVSVQKYAEKKWNNDLPKDNANKLLSLFKMQEEKLFKIVTIRNFNNSEISPDNIQHYFDSVAVKYTNNDVLLMMLNGIIVQETESHKYYFVTPNASLKDFEQNLLPLDVIIKTILKTKATSGLFINLSIKSDKLPPQYQLVDDEQLNQYMDKQLTSRKGIFYLSLNNPQTLSMFDILANALHPNNDVDKNGIVDLNEVSGFLNHIAKIQVFYRPNFIPLYVK